MLTANAREQMIEQQVRAWEVLDERVLGIFRKVPRDPFVPAEHRYLAYADFEVPLPKGQHMLRPSVAGRLLQALELAREAARLRWCRCRQLVRQVEPDVHAGTRRSAAR